MLNNKYLNSSNHQESDRFSSTKKRITTPALLFCKSTTKETKFVNENNSSLMNKNKSPIRQYQMGKFSVQMSSPVNNKDSQSKVSFQIGRSGLNDLSIFQSIHYCENHQNKAASYVSSIYQNNFEYYCQKCAILLASQGYSVEKIADVLQDSRNLQISRNTMNNSSISQKSLNSNRSKLSVSQTQNSRRQQINGFLDLTRQLMGQIEYKKQEIHENLIQSEQFYGNQIQEVNEYFQLVFKSLELQKNKCYNHILNQRFEVEQPVRMINDMIGQLKEKIQNIIQDIEENIQIVYQTADDVYRPVIEQYQQNYQDIQNKISQIQIFPIQMRKIDFQGVPQSIFYLSETLKDSIQNDDKFIQNQKKMNGQMISLRESIKENLPPIQPRMLFTKKSSERNNFCFSFEADALKEQLSDQKIIYESQQ